MKQEKAVKPFFVLHKGLSKINYCNTQKKSQNKIKQNVTLCHRFYSRDKNEDKRIRITATIEYFLISKNRKTCYLRAIFIQINATPFLFIGIIGPIWGSLAVQDHLRSNSKTEHVIQNQTISGVRFDISRLILFRRNKG